VCPTKTAQKQTKLAQAAINNPEYRFSNLYSLMHWRPWIENAALRVLARPGSSTAGVDGVTRRAFERNYEKEINRLIESLKRKTYKPQPVRRTYIPKSKGRKRPLGIPALRDRIVQEALRAILDPIYESDFQHHSYGFRKGRCTMDAVTVLMPLFNNMGKFYYIIEGDIRSYFDNVHHRKLMSILRRRIKDRAVLTLIWKFLKAGVMEGPLFAESENGVPQGGVISPLLANTYLNEFDKWAEERWHTLTPYQRKRKRSNGLGNQIMVRYADDFVVVSNGPITQVREVKEQIKEYLASELHLELSEEKTRITHVNDGFDFLGFHIQRVKSNGRWAVHLRPTKENKRRVKRKLKELTSKKWIWLDEYTRLTTLNWIVRGWCEYYRYTSLLSDLEEITRYTWFRYLAWLLKKHEGSRKKRLIRSKTAKRYNRTRWKAEVREGDKALTRYQWLPTRTELKRQRYPKKGRNGFLHPYLDEKPLETDYPTGEVRPSESSSRKPLPRVAKQTTQGENAGRFPMHTMRK
jgi:group II intron reverse transcriptase/maturase